jgi:hypothetical protein
MGWSVHGSFALATDTRSAPPLTLIGHARALAPAADGKKGQGGRQIVKTVLECRHEERLAKKTSQTF